MKILKYIPLFMAAVGVLSSCEKHEIEFPMDNVNSMTQVQIHYFVPTSTATANNIYKIELGDQVYVQPNNASIMSTYNGQPSGSVGLFYTVKEDEPVLRYYLGPDHKLAYDRKVKLIHGRKQNVIVYDFDKDPLVIDTGYGENGFTFDVTPSYYTDSIGYVRFRVKFSIRLITNQDGLIMTGLNGKMLENLSHSGNVHHGLLLK